DALDNDCNGKVDDGLVVKTWYKDGDRDGYGTTKYRFVSCAPPAGYVADSTDCNDGSKAVYPGAPEICDALDNDCNGIVDDGSAVQAWYKDADKDGYGNIRYRFVSCVAPAGYVADSTDCNDASNVVYPGAPEICDALDNDCNGIIDDGFVVQAWYKDVDKDGYGNIKFRIVSCMAPAGYVADSTDCNDASNVVYPGAPELCDALDNDCNGKVDDGLIVKTWYKDGDKDGYGTTRYRFVSCAPPAGYVADSTDCNDGNST
ncbi:MopE-related protein, partial [Paraflavisolibacter sp. H34]|uniref:putative metal-binding motif-containing protein n=1 Tax=Huijunlia imazamoxiresistens TaxID=3127457 RepID=UPI0030192290